MSLVLNPQIFAGRLSRDAMHGWFALLRRGHEVLLLDWAAKHRPWADKKALYNRALKIAERV